MIGALGATPTICLQQHDCVATLIGKASSESEGAGEEDANGGIFNLYFILKLLNS